MQPMLDAGWPRHHDDLGNFYLSSPDTRLRIGFMPEGTYSLWYVAAYPDPFGAPQWTAWACDHTPEEVVGALLSCTTTTPPQKKNAS
jgi:hypothetical protein